MRLFRSYGVELILIAILIVSVGFFGYLGYGLLTPDLVPDDFSGVQALDMASRQLEFGARVTGTQANERMGDWLVEELRKLGWDVVIQPFSAAGEISARNITAVKGAGPQERPVAIVGAPYDSRRFSDSDPDPAKHDQPSPGANKNAAGVAILLELARTLDVDATGHTVCLAFFDAEANAGIEGWDVAMGSSQFVQRLDNDIFRCSSPRFAAIVNQVGGADHKIYIERTSTPNLSNAIWETAGELGFGDWIIPESKQGVLDAHLPFIQAGIPAATLVDPEFVHANTTQDTLNKLSSESLERVGRTLKTWLEKGAPFAE